MVKSMTGYSRRRREEAGFSLSVGLKATNHRFLDVQVRVPSELEPLEGVLRGIIKDRVTRGHVEVTVSLERTGPGMAPEVMTLVGKVRARGADTATFRLLAALRSRGFDDASADGIDDCARSRFVSAMHSASREIGTHTSVGHPFDPGRSASAA